MSLQMKQTNLAIVLLDIIGSTKFVQKVGAARAAKHLQYHDKLTRNLIYRFNGREIDRSDGFLCSFDTTIDAVNFGLHYQKNVPPKTYLHCRIGIHWGPIVEVIQEDVYVAANAKRIELEGISKNIAARTMSLCLPGQVLLTKEALAAVKNRTNMFTPKGTRFVCVGLYKFKGVAEPQELYAVGTTIESLQPPQGSEKVKRLGGPKKIAKRVRDRKILDWLAWLFKWLSVINFIYLTFELFIPVIRNDLLRRELGITYLDWLGDLLNYIAGIIKW